MDCPSVTPESEAKWPAVKTPSLAGTGREVISFTWTLRNYSLYRSLVGEEIESPDFCVHSDADTKWCLVLHPAKVLEGEGEFVSVYLQLVTSEESEVCAEYKFAILSACGQAVNVRESAGAEPFTRRCARGFEQFVRTRFLLDSRNGVLLNNTLTLYAEISVRGTIETSPTDIPRTQSCVDLVPLPGSPGFSDVTLCFDDCEFDAHKTVLEYRCPVLASVVERSTFDKNQRRVRIGADDPAVFSEVLRFIYSGRTNRIDRMPVKLLVAGRKYGLDQLVDACEEFLCSSLSVETAVRMLKFADKRRADRLKAAAIDFIVANALEITKTAEWKALASELPRLAGDVCDKMVGRLAAAMAAYHSTSGRHFENPGPHFKLSFNFKNLF